MTSIQCGGHDIFVPATDSIAKPPLRINAFSPTGLDVAAAALTTG